MGGEGYFGCVEARAASASRVTCRVITGGKGVIGGRVVMRECSTESAGVKAGGLFDIAFVGFGMFKV